MNESIRTKKQTDYQQIQHHFKSYKQNYHNRPLQSKNINTYLELSKFISKLPPTFLAHYGTFAQPSEIQYLTKQIMSLYDDVFNKLRYSVEKLERKEKQQMGKKNYGEMCSVCMKDLRNVEVENAKEEIEANQMSRNIKNIIRDIQNQQTFTSEEDRAFFKQLKIALDKKQQVLQLCSTQSLEFTNFIEDQLKDLMNARDMFVIDRKPRDPDASSKGTQLKDNVSKSIKEHMSVKIPNIIKIVGESFKRSYQRERRSKWVHMEAQTADNQSNKLTDMRRKVAAAENVAVAAKAEKDKLEWTVKQKQLLIQKIEKQLGQVREEMNSKSFELHKQIKNLDQRCKKYKDELQRHKSRKQIFDRQNEPGTMKNFKTIHKLKQVTLMEQDDVRRKEGTEQQEQDKRMRKKKTLHTIKSGSSKYFLPTLTKINHKQQSQLMSRTELSADNFDRQDADLNKTTKTEVIRRDQQDAVVEDQGRVKLSKTTSMQKKENGGTGNKKVATMVYKNSPLNQSRSKANSNSKDVKNSKKSEHSKGRISAFQNGKQLPLITQRSMKKGIRINDVPEQLSEAEAQKIAQQVELRSSVQKVSNALKDTTNKAARASYTSLNSAVSILQNATNEPNQNRKTHKQSILKPHKDQKSQLKKVRRMDTEPDATQIQNQGQNENTDRSFVTNPTSRNKSERNTHKKGYLRNSYSLIKEDVDKENYMTPVMGAESPGYKAKQSGFKKTISKLEKNISNMINKITKEKKDMLEMNQNQFNQLFVECLKNMSSTKSKDQKEKKSSNPSRSDTIDKQKQQDLKKEQKYAGNTESQEGRSSNNSNGSNKNNQNSTKKQKILNEIVLVLSNQRTKPSVSIKKNRDSHNNSHRNSLDPATVDLNQSFAKINSISPVTNLQKASSKFEHRGQNYIKSHYSTQYQALKKSIQRKQYNATKSPLCKGSPAHLSHVKSKYQNLSSDNTDSLVKYRLNKNSQEMLQKGQTSPQKSKALNMKRIQLDSFSIIQAMKLDYTLFIDQQKCYEYECNYKKGNKTMSPLTTSLQTYIRQLYSILDDLKHLNNQAYQQLCSYMRYPFTNSQQGCFHIDIIQNISLSSLTSSFQKIMPIHRRCRNQNGLCSHLTHFRKKIVDYISKIE